MPSIHVLGFDITQVLAQTLKISQVQSQSQTPSLELKTQNKVSEQALGFVNCFK